MSRVELADLSEFLAAVARAGQTRVVLRVVSEVRPKVEEGHRVIVGMQRWCELFAYDAGAVLTSKLVEADPDALERELESAGLVVRRVSGNIT